MLYFTIGPARCGKSTFCNEWIKQTSLQYDNDEGYIELPRNRAIVCADSIRLCLTGQRFCKEAEHFVQSTKWLMVESLLHRGHEVIIDGTHTSNHSIEKVLSMIIYYLIENLC